MSNIFTIQLAYSYSVYGAAYMWSNGVTHYLNIKYVINYYGKHQHSKTFKTVASTNNQKRQFKVLGFSQIKSTRTRNQSTGRWLKYFDSHMKLAPKQIYLDLMLTLKLGGVWLPSKPKETTQYTVPELTDKLSS